MDLFPNLNDFFVSEAKKGIMLRYADIVFGKYFIYILTPQNYLYPCVIYQAILSNRDYVTKGKPLIHFCNCRILWEIFDRHYNNLKAKIPECNAFDFKVGVIRSSVEKEFYDVELPFCSQCIKLYETLFLKFNAKQNMELWNLLFADKQLVLSEKIAIESDIDINQRFTSMNASICDRYFRLHYNKEYLWL